MSKDSTNFIFVLLIIYFIYKWVSDGLTTVWNWLIDFLIDIGTWIQINIELILICLGVIIFVPLLLKIIFKQEQSITPPSKSFVAFSTPINEKEKHSDQWNQVKQNPRLALTKKMKEIMNEMLKSNIHHKRHHDSYIQLLNDNGYGYVYFVKSPNTSIKIGMTSGDPFKRILKIMGGVNTSYNVEVIHLIRTDQPEQIEKEFHLCFAKKRYINPHNPKQKSEFFFLDDEDIYWIKQQLYPDKITKYINY